MNVLSLFDGMSCAQVALERAGIPVENYFASEIDKYAIKIAMKNYPNTIQLGSVSELVVSELPKIDLLFGGFPCQSYSVAGKRDGIKSKNGELIFDLFRILKETKPKYALLENVKGLLSIDKGETFKNILKELNNCGYAVDFRMINSNLVSAQNRERIYVICKRLDLCQGNVTNVDLTKEIINATLKKSTNSRTDQTL